MIATTMTPEQSTLWTEFHKAGLDFDTKMAAKEN